MTDKFMMSEEDFLPLRDVVFHRLRKAILTGELKPGERLMELHLANKLGVSRTPIREAIHKLALEGLVTMAPRRGAEVAQITEKSMQDVLEVRRTLDVLCVELACERMTKESLEELQQASLSFEKAIAMGDLQLIAKEDVKFHDIIVKATGNDRLVQLIHNLAEQMYRYRFEYIKDINRHQNLVKEHQMICQAIMECDREKAAKAAMTHIDNQRASIIAQIRREQAKTAE